MHEGSEKGTNPPLLVLLQNHAVAITKLMSENWGTVVDETEPWPRMKTKRSHKQSQRLRNLFIIYVEKTLRWLDYFVLDPRWLNLTAVNYAANAAREAASEVREARLKFEEEFGLTREDLGAASKNGAADEEAVPDDESTDAA